MFNVLIADDEAIVRMMLSSMVDWDEMELKLLGCVANGREAIHYLEQYQVDILITDIQMPVVDGLELIRYAIQMKETPQILVLSAYNDFPYVRQAFKMGIYDYCLKREINEELLSRHLQNMKQHLLKNGRTQVDVEEQNNEQKSLLKQLLRGEIEAEAAKLPKYYYVVCFSIQGYQRLAQSFGNDLNQEFFPALLNLASQITSNGVIVSTNITSLVMLYEPKGEPSSFVEILRICTRILRVWKNYMNVDVTAGVSRLATGCCDFESALTEATLNLTMKYVMKSKKLFSPDDYPRFSPVLANAAAANFRELIHALKLNDTAHYEAEKYRILSKIQSLELPVALQQATYLVYQIASALIHQIEDMDYIYTTDLLEELYNLQTSHEVYIWLVNFLNDIIKYMQSHYQFDFPDEIQRAVNYISDHYYRADLSLYEVAAAVGFSEKYFSTLFNKKVGMSFSGYLKKIRIHHAKNLLKGTHMKLGEISKEVGYNSVEYFVRVFSAQTGMSPSTFRKKGHTIVQ